MDRARDMGSEPIRVAQIMGKMINGGVEAVVMNYYRHIDRRKVQFDFIIDADSTHTQFLKNEIEGLGGRIYIVPPYQKLTEYISALIRIFHENSYQIVHSHINSLSVFSLYAAKKAGVPVRIAHSHSTAAPGEWKKNIFKYILRPFSRVNATHYAACSKLAGEWLFGKKAMREGRVTIFNNAIDLEKYRFNEEVRNEVRDELGIQGKFVVGHVGNFRYQKNQNFVIDIFEKIHDLNPESVLLMIGDGEDFERIRARVEGLAEKAEGIQLLGNRKDCDRLYQAMDLLLLPSRYEGLGIVAIEAQVRELRVLASTNVPVEAKISDGIEFLSLAAGTRSWEEAALQTIKKINIHDESKAAYDICIQAKNLENFYEKNKNEKM